MRSGDGGSLSYCGLCFVCPFSPLIEPFPLFLVISHPPTSVRLALLCPLIPYSLFGVFVLCSTSGGFPYKYYHSPVSSIDQPLSMFDRLELCCFVCVMSVCPRRLLQLSLHRFGCVHRRSYVRVDCDHCLECEILTMATRWPLSFVVHLLALGDSWVLY